jgi:O-antigen/teichoic acid export membrane protein
VRDPFKNVLRGPLRLFAQTAGTRILGLASSALLVVLLSRELDPAQYGIYALFTTTYIFGTLVLGLGLSNNLTSLVPGRDDETAERLLATFFVSEVVVGAALLALSIAASPTSSTSGGTYRSCVSFSFSPGLTSAPAAVSTTSWRASVSAPRTF